ncbi:MAG: LamG domain-containing protein [Litoreibacter sp.]
MKLLTLSVACLAAMAVSGSASTLEPIAFFTFDNGITTDDSGNGNNGIAHAGTSISVGTSQDGTNALALSAVNGTSGIETNIDINKSAFTSMTMGGWVYATGNGNGPGGKFLSHDNGAFGRTLGLDTRGNSSGIDFSAFNGSGVTDADGTGSLLGSWVHLAVVYDGANSGLYVNGVLDELFTDNTSTSPGLTAGLFIGTNNHFNEDFQGFVDDVFIYDRALSSTDVSDIFSNGIVASTSVSAVPLPAGLPLLLAGLGGLGLVRSRRS